MTNRLASRLRPLLRILSARVNRSVYGCRKFHERKADFVAVHANGSLETRKLDIIAGDPHEAYVIVDQDAGFAMRSAILKQAGPSPAADADKVPLTFYHDSRYFAHHAMPYPRIVIEHDLPHQTPSDTSPATLWLWGATHSITLDGTPDDKFEEACRESHARLEGAAELLKHK